MASLVGRSLDNKYEIQRLLGQGGMATVYLGFQPSLERNVAIKVLPPHPGLDAMFIDRFQLEAKTVARLQHPHILPLYDHGVVDDILYLVVPYIGGGALEDVMRDGSIDLKYSERILHQIAGALDYAHKQGVIHRDIKPANILLDDEGNALLADFGIAKIAGDNANLTGTGVVGTPAYMSPEQCQGMPLDARADIYSLGVVVYELLCGKQPYEADTPITVMMKHVYDAPPDILAVAPRLPAQLGPVMMRVLAKEPLERYQTAMEFANDVSAALAGKTPSVTLPPVTRNLHQTPSTSPTIPISAATPATTQQPTIIVQQQGNTRVLIVGFALLALLILGGFGLLIYAATRPQEPTTVADIIRDRLEDRLTPPDATQVATEPTNTPRAVAAVDLNAPGGRAIFGAAEQPGDSVNIRVRNIGLPEQGKVYVAWLVNTADNSTLNLGRIAFDATGEGSVGYSDAESRFLPALYNEIRLTLEAASNVAGALPQGEVVYQGVLPAAITEAIGEFFIASDAGFGGRGLLESAVREARFAQQHAGYASDARNAVGMRNHAEHTLQILNGGEEDYDGNGRVSNPGTGIGLYAFLDSLDDTLEALSAAEAIDGDTLGEIDNMRICLSNVRTWADEIVRLESEVVVARDMETVADQLAASTLLASQLVNGVDLNEDGQVAASEGECGLFQAGATALLIATIDIQPVTE